MRYRRRRVLRNDVDWLGMGREVVEVGGGRVSCLGVEEGHGEGRVEGLVAQVLIRHPHQDLARPGYDDFAEDAVRNLIYKSIFLLLDRI